VLACVVAALVPIGVLHVAGVGVVDPLTTTISDYVLVDGGYALFGLAAAALAGASGLLAAALRRSGLAAPGLPAALLASASGGFLLTAVFPTHAPGSVPGAASLVHRAAGGWVLAALPLAAWLVARRARTSPGWISAAPLLGVAAGATGALSAGYLLTHVLIVIAGSHEFPLIGGAERVLYGAVLLVLVATARAARVAADRTLRAMTVPTGADVRGSR
jgi:hypothetical protein